MRRSPFLLPLPLLVSSLSLACSGEDDGRQRDGNPDGGGEPSGFGRHEPEERIDFDNVAGDADELTLELPEPPKSGFRLIVPPRTLAPAAEEETCVAWEYPEFQHKNVYAARLYTTGALHHSNMYGVPLTEDGPSPYPACNPGQASVFSQVDNFQTGNIMDVLFANSTQIEGGEALVFPEGMAFRVTTEGREVATSIHWLNPTPEDVTSEVVYDFYTMPDDLVEEELVPFVFDNQAFTVPKQSTNDIVTTCDITDDTAKIVTIMPHTHKRATEFTVDLIDESGESSRIFTSTGFDVESDIEVYEEPIALSGFSRIRHTCRVENELSEDIVWGVGDNEMCTLFGYLYPPSAQQLGIVLRNTTDCLAANIGMYRGATP